MINKFIILSTLMAISTTAFSKSRVEDIMISSSQDRLEKIVEIEQALVKGKKELSELEVSLNNAKVGNGKHELYIKKAELAGLVTLASIGMLYAISRVGNERIAKAMLTNSFSHPSESENVITVLGLLGLGGGGIASAVTGAEVCFSFDEVNTLKKDIQALNLNIDRKKSELKTEIKLLCKDDPRHELCY